jgi:hypothetical protein
VTIVLPLAEFMLRETFEDFTDISYRVPIGASLTTGSFTHSSASGLGHAEDGQLDGEESHTSFCASQSGSGTAMRRVTRPRRLLLGHFVNLKSISICVYTVFLKSRLNMHHK